MIPKNFLDSAYRELTNNELESFQNLYTNFVQKNKIINLSAIRDEQGIWEKHFYDSLLGAEFLEDADEKILDLGSGGGFPALPLALMFPGKQFFPFDSVEKKMKAVQEIVNTSKIDNVTPLIGRAEELGQDALHREQYDVVTVRAFAPFSVCLELALPFVTVGGKVILYRGPENERDANLLAGAFGAIIKTQKKDQLPSKDKREIWEIIKIAPTEDMFPRANGIPKKEPMTLKSMNYE